MSQIFNSLFFLFLIILSAFIIVSESTKVQKCADGPKVEESEISIGGCDKPPCRLRKGTTVKASFTFTPNKKIESLRNTVNAEIVGIPFPFIGVDGSNACNQIYLEDGQTKASCPLQAGQKYVYKNQFDVLQIYPTLKLVVYWALTGPDDSNALCFRVPARIVN